MISIISVAYFRSCLLPKKGVICNTALRLETKEFFANLVEAKDPETGEGLTERHIVSETGSLLLAGSGTKGTTSAATIYYCVHSPEILHVLQRDIHNTFINVEDMQIATHLNSCQYLRACLDQSLRHSSPIGGLLVREILTGGLILDGEPLSAGVDVGVAHYAIHQNEAYFPDPFSFKPDRR